MILLVVYLIAGEEPSLWWLQAFYYSACTAFLVIGLSYLTSAANVFFKDMGQLVQVILQIGMWMAPIMWSENMFSERIGRIVRFNPFYYIVEGYRDCFIHHKGFWEHPNLTLYFWGVSIVIFGIGAIMFKKLRPHFADVL